MDVAHLVPARVIRRSLRAPVLHFFLVGSAIWAAGILRPMPAADGSVAPVVVSEGAIEALRTGFVARTGRDPDEGEMRSLVEGAVDEAVLERRARDLGLDRGNRFVRDRLIRNLRFVWGEGGSEGEGAEATDEELYREAVALGLDRSDLVVRRHLAQTVRMLLAAGSGEPEEPREAELEKLLDREADRFGIPERVTVTHVHLSAARRGERARPEALALLARLRSDGVPPEAVSSLGDPFFRGRRFVLHSAKQLAAIFGPDTAAAMMRAPEGRWAGPLRSPTGEHLVWLEERRSERRPALGEVREELTALWRRECREARVRKSLDGLRREYEVRVEEPRRADGESRPATLAGVSP